MNFSMTFKKNILLILLFCMISAVPAHKASASAENTMPEEPGDILLVYEDNPNEQVRTNLEKIVNMASAMGKIIDYGCVKECTDVMENYSYIICFDLQNPTVEFEIKFLESTAKRMVIGSSFLKKYLQRIGLSQLIQYEEPQKKGRLAYCFSEEEEYEELIEVQGCLDIQRLSYKNGSIYIGGREYPFCSQVEEIRFIPLTDFSGTLSEASLMHELQDWMWPYQDNPPDYAQYIVIDEVYPFIPANELMEMVELLSEQQVPYIISVMPVSRNEDYPSMKQFCQVLAYAQKNNGMVILHAPIIHKKVTDIEELYEELTTMTMTYVENGVYPLGIQIPYSWTNQEIYQEVLKRYRTVFVYDDGENTGFSLDAHTNVFCRQGHQLVYPLIRLDDSGVSKLRCYSSAVYLNCSTDQEEVLQIIENNRVSANPFTDMWDLDHSVWLNDFEINFQNHVLYLNGKRTEITYEPAEYDEDYDFGRATLQKVSVSLQNQNKLVLVIVIISIIIFASFIIYARIRNRRRFIYKDRKK